MSTATVHPLHLVEPPPQRQRYAWLLLLKSQAARAWDAARSAPRQAVTLFTRLLPAARAMGFRGWLSLPWRTLSAAVRRLGTSGTVATVLGLLSDRRARAVIGKVARVGLRLLGQIAGLGISVLRKGLHLFGAPGKRVAARMDRALTSAGVSVLIQLERVRQAWTGLLARNPRSIGAIASLSRITLVHRLLRGSALPPAIRLLLEAALLPGSLARSVWNQAARLWRGRPTQADAEGPRRMSFPREWTAHERSLAAEAGVVLDEDAEDDRPANRAERRAQQRQQARKGNRPTRPA